LFEYSISRFIEQYFYNTKLQEMNKGQCPHCPLRDYTRFFHLADGSTITFKFTREEVYTIELLNIKQQQNNLLPLIEVCSWKKSEINHVIKVKDAFFRGQMAAIQEFIDDFEQRHPELREYAGASRQREQSPPKAKQTIDGEPAEKKDEYIQQFHQWLEVIKRQLQKLQSSFALFVKRV